MIMAHLRPQYSLAGDSNRAPPTAPSGMPEFTKLFCLGSRPKSLGKKRLAPEIKLWSRPERRPPILANATSSHVKCRGSRNLMLNMLVSRPPAASSWASISSIKTLMSWTSGVMGAKSTCPSIPAFSS